MKSLAFRALTQIDERLHKAQLGERGNVLIRQLRREEQVLVDLLWQMLWHSGPSASAERDTHFSDAFRLDKRQFGHGLLPAEVRKLEKVQGWKSIVEQAGAMHVVRTSKVAIVVLIKVESEKASREFRDREQEIIPNLPFVDFERSGRELNSFL